MKRALTNGYLIDGTGGAPLLDATILLEDDHIETVGIASKVSLPPDVQVIDLAGRSVLPGLIDLHTHCTFQYHFYSATYRSETSPYSDTLLALAAVPRLQEALLAGQTTLRDLGAIGRTAFELRQAIEEGFIQGPRLCVAGQLIVPTNGHLSAEPRLVAEADGEVAARAEVRHRIEAGADFIKLAINDTEWTQAELTAAVDEAHRWGRKAACHVLFPASTKMAIAAGVDSREHARFFDDEDVAAMIDRDIAWVAVASGVRDKLPMGEKFLERAGLPPALRQEIEATLDLSRKVVAAQPGNFERALAAGVKIGAGTDRTGAYGKDHFADLARELEVMHEMGLSPMQAIQSATGVAAEIIGWEDRVGTIAPGLLADILVVNGNPLEDLDALRDVALVIKGGEIIVSREFIGGSQSGHYTPTSHHDEHRSESTNRP